MLKIGQTDTWEEVAVAASHSEHHFNNDDEDGDDDVGIWHLRRRCWPSRIHSLGMYAHYGSAPASTLEET